MEETNTPANALTADEKRYIDRAQNNRFEDGGIIRYYEQAVQNRVHEAVVEAIELRMRADFPRSAKTVFGAKGNHAEQLLARVRETVMARFDITSNSLGNHVKVGGDERRTGTAYIYRYLSYRESGQQRGAQISLIQDNPAAELRVKVRSYRVRSAEPDELQFFAAGEVDLACEAYLILLERLAVPVAQPT